MILHNLDWIEDFRAPDARQALLLSLTRWRSLRVGSNPVLEAVVRRCCCP